MKRITLAASLAAFALITACGAEDAETEAEAIAVAGEDEAVLVAAPEQEEAPALEPVAAPEGSMAANEMALGAEDAPLTIVEYASVTCPGCAAFHRTLFPQIKERFIDTGEVRFVYREFPTPPQQLSYIGFILSRCAATQTGAPTYFSMIEALYERQQEWVSGPSPAASLENIFSEVGFDRARIEQCLRRQDIIDAINENVQSGVEAGVNRTPTLLIDGEPFDYGRSLDEALERIQAEVDARS